MGTSEPWDLKKNCATPSAACYRHFNTLHERKARVFTRWASPKMQLLMTFCTSALEAASSAKAVCSAKLLLKACNYTVLPKLPSSTAHHGTAQAQASVAKKWREQGR